jgi:hypothetical protein
MAHKNPAGISSCRLNKTTKMKNTRILFIAALILSVGMQAEAKKVNLKYQLKAGTEFKYEVAMSQESAQEVMGNSQSSTNSTTTTLDFKVLEVTSTGDMNMKAALVALSLTGTSPAGEMKFNSATDTVIPEFAKMSSLGLNQYYTFTLSPLGKITDLKAPEGFVEKLDKLIAEQGASTMGMGAVAGAAAGPEGFQKSLEGIFLTFPEGGAEVKKPWNVESKINQMVPMKVNSKYELVNSTKETNELKVNSQISVDPDAPPMDIQGMKMSFELVGAKEGKITLDAVTGLINAVEATTSISGNISIEGPQLPTPMSIPMTVRMTEKISKK